MDFQQDIKSSTYLKMHSADILASVNRTRRPLVITQNGKARAVVQDVASYEATRRALLLLKLVTRGEADVRKRKVLSHSELIGRIENRLPPEPE